jgi:putative transposase
MARLRFAVGVRYLRQGQVYCIVQLLLEHRVLVENQSFGGQMTVPMDELYTAWAAGDLRFEVRGVHAQQSPDHPIATAYTFADFQHLPRRQRDEAWRRYQLLLPLLQRPPHERTKSAIDAYVQDLQAAQPDPDPGAKADALGAACSRASLERWLARFIESGSDIRALVPHVAGRARKGERRVDQEVEAVLQAVLQECQTHPQHRTIQDVYLTVVNRIAEENRTRPDHCPLAPPSFATIRRRIHHMGTQAILRRSRSRAEQQADESVQASLSLQRILERAEIDHTLLDLFLVDEDDRLPIGRPTLSCVVDVYSGFPLGIWVSFVPPSYASVMHCLRHAILPKPDTRQVYGTVHPWRAYGLPEKLVVDNGPEFIGHDLDDACAQLGIILERMPVRTPWFKGSVERFFRTQNTSLIHTLPGTTFSTILERGDYDPFHHACISLSAFWKLLHVFLLDYYAQKWHAGRGCIPARRWQEAVQAGFVPALHTSAEETRLLLYPRDTRTLQRSGIDFEALRYQSPDLARLRSLLPKGTVVSLKYDPDDISALYICDPTASGSAPHWLRVPAVDQTYTQGLSLWKHRIIRQYVLREQGAVDIVALAAAKQTIQQIVAEEFRMTRKGRGRKTAARLLDHGMPPAPGPAPAAAAPAPVAAPAPRTTPAAPAAPEIFDTTGWGSDYDLPQRKPYELPGDDG